MKSILAGLETVLPISELMSLPTDGGLMVEPDFQPADCQILKEQLDLLGLDRVEGALTIRRWRGKGLSIRGHLTADIVQACVVTLDPVEQSLRTDVDMMLFPGADPLDMESEIDPLPTTELDIGAIIAEHLALAIDPYPRKKGVEFAEVRDNSAESSPFEALRVLKDGDSA
jgi:uncharacterized metal-binding protein YceD (DUF177 family)